MSAQFPPPHASISVEELAQRLHSGATEALQLIDVRELAEIAIAFIPGFDILPLSQFNQWAEQITTRFDPHQETLVLCHHGVRSAQMCQWLIAQGFTNVKNITGGIDAYANECDRAIALY
ncbi:MAG: rhodanese-related sulfurtransferase [Chroococcus sp. CMT-3BRIN-NPC107]|nr:rhodanese-related sulfurtransferase [Chroococcus sp. CMT-3BRIN-NPC107]